MPVPMSHTEQSEMKRMAKPRILFIMHMPPPVHGAAMMGQYIHDSALVKGSFDCRFINLAIARGLKDVGHFRFGKAADYLRLLATIRREIRAFSPDLVYVTPNTVGVPFFKDLVITGLIKSMGCRVVAHYHNKGVATRQDRWLDDRLYRLAFRNQKNILLSERLFADISRYADRRDVYIVPNGIPSTVGTPSPKASGGPLRILFLSNMMQPRVSGPFSRPSASSRGPRPVSPAISSESGRTSTAKPSRRRSMNMPSPPGSSATAENSVPTRKPSSERPMSWPSPRSLKPSASFSWKPCSTPAPASLPMKEASRTS